MPKIAIGVVLFPSNEIQDICVDLCKKFRDNSRRMPLNKIDNLPHISLFMGAVDVNRLDEIFAKIKKLSKNLKPLNLLAEKLTNTVNSIKSPTYYFQIKKTSKLQSIHEKLINNLSDYYAKQTKAEMYFKKHNEKIARKTFFWVDNYVTGSSLKKFWPHITLKACQNPFFNNLPIKFTVNRLAICHLGDHCTCRKILYEIPLKS